MAQMLNSLIAWLAGAYATVTEGRSRTPVPNQDPRMLFPGIAEAHFSFRQDEPRPGRLREQVQARPDPHARILA